MGTALPSRPGKQLSPLETSDRSELDHEGMIRRAIVGSLHAAHRVRQLTGIENVCHHDLSAETLEPIAPGVRDTDGGSYWPPFGQQLSNNSATGPSGCAGYENFWVSHNKESRVVFCCRYDIVP